jgi:hypothetical protein
MGFPKVTIHLRSLLHAFLQRTAQLSRSVGVEGIEL